MSDAALPAAAGIEPTRRRSRHAWWRPLIGRDAVMIYALVVVVLFAMVRVDRFASTLTVGFLLLDIIPILLIALPMTFVIISGEIDLSVASTAGLTCAVMGRVWEAHQNMWLVVVLCLLVGVACGAVNGLLIAGAGLPSIAVTIGTLALYRGLALVVIGDDAVASFPIGWTSFATEKLGGTGIPKVMIGVAVLIVVFAVVLHVTTFGRALYAVGLSPEAARFVGVRVRRMKFSLYVVTGLVSAATGIFWTLRYSSARSDNASGLELAVIAAVLLGGVSIFGGKGSVIGVVAAVGLIGVITYAMRLDRVAEEVLIIVTGSLLILSVVAPRPIEGAGRLRHRQRLRREQADGTGASPSPATQSPPTHSPTAASVDGTLADGPRPAGEPTRHAALEKGSTSP